MCQGQNLALTVLYVPRPESGLDCLACAMFARQRQLLMGGLYVFGLDVSMHNALRVDVVDRTQDLRDHARGLRLRKVVLSRQTVHQNELLAELSPSKRIVDSIMSINTNCWRHSVNQHELLAALRPSTRNTNITPSINTNCWRHSVHQNELLTALRPSIS